MNKKAVAILLSCMLSIPMLTGCSNSENEVHIKLFGKEVYSREKDNKEIKDGIEGYDKQTPTHTDDEVIHAIIDGRYDIGYNGENYTIPTIDVLNILFPNSKVYTQLESENVWLVKFDDGTNYILYRLDFNKMSLEEVELKYNGTIFTDDEAHNNLLNLIVTEIIDKEEVKEEVKEDKKEEKKKEEKKEENEPTDYDDRHLQSTCKYCGKTYYTSTSNAWEPENFCNKECHAKYEEQQQAKQQKTCKWCNTNKLPSGAGDEDKCSECQEENWNWHCNDCNKSMSLSEYNSTGRETGFCPPCYEKYKQATQDTEVDHKHYYCGRCGRDVTGKNFLPDIEGYDFLCEGCLMELGY